MRWHLASIVVLVACAPPIAPAQRPVPEDRSKTSGPSPPVAEPAKQSFAPVTLAEHAGLRLALEHRGLDFAVAPGRVIVLGEDFTQLEALDPNTSESQWRTRVQGKPNGRHTLHLQGEQVILHAGPTRIHVALADGRVLGSYPASFNGNGLGCAVRVYEGAALADWGAWLAPSRAGSACAETCECELRLFDCTAGTAIGPPYRASESHLYNDEGTEHSTDCEIHSEPVLRAAAATIVRIEDEQHKPSYRGLDPVTGARLWDRSDLGAALSQYSTIAGTDPDGRLCWLGDGARFVMLDCAAGTTRWQASTGGAEANGHDAALWHAGDVVLRHQDERRSTIELREAKGGKRRWQRSFAADRLPLLIDEPLPEFFKDEVGAYLVLDPATGATLGEISLRAGQTLHAAPEGGYLRIGAGQLAEFDARGKLLRERPLADSSGATDLEFSVTTHHLIERTRARMRLLRRDSLQPVLNLEGLWSVRPSRAALGPDALVLVEHRGQDPGRILVLQPAS